VECLSQKHIIPLFIKATHKKSDSFLKLPVVVKECNTSGGEGVFLAKSASALEKTIKSLLKKFDKKEIFLRSLFRMISNTGS